VVSAQLQDASTILGNAEIKNFKKWDASTVRFD
jgi:hypothetical protein